MFVFLNFHFSRIWYVLAGVNSETETSVWASDFTFYAFLLSNKKTQFKLYICLRSSGHFENSTRHAKVCYKVNDKRESYPYNRPWRPVGLWDVKVPTFSRQSAHRWQWGLPPGRFLVLISVRDWVHPRAIVHLERLDQLKNPMTSSGIEPATFRLLA
jgi:hypothetical protein